MKRISLILAALLPLLSVSALNEGGWRGKLALGPAKLTFVINIDAAGGCTVDSPDQGAFGIPAVLKHNSADSVAVDIPAIRGAFAGRVAGGKIDGKFRQSGYTFPLVLEADKPEAERRPQTPVAPFPYTEQVVKFANADSSLLEATVVVPDKPAAGRPAVVFVTGSGPQNRDEELFDHKPFRLLADRLARAGIASLRYDDRGTANSQGDFASATTLDFRDDAAAAVEKLRQLGVAQSVGVIGHSEGGTIAFMLAAEGKVDFAVSLAGAALSGKEIILKQNRDALAASGLPDDQCRQAVELVEVLLDSVAAGVAPDVDAIVARLGLNLPAPMIASIRQGVTAGSSPWHVAFLNLDPSASLAAVRCPLLALNGGKDSQVEASANLSAISRLCPAAKVVKYPELNHLFQHCATGSVTEYGEIAETFAEEAIADIIAFILNCQADR